MYYWYQKLSEDYPYIVRLHKTIGKSYYERDIMALHFTDRSELEDKPKIYLQCLLHSSKLQLYWRCSDIVQWTSHIEYDYSPYLAYGIIPLKLLYVVASILCRTKLCWSYMYILGHISMYAHLQGSGSVVVCVCTSPIAWQHHTPQTWRWVQMIIQCMREYYNCSTVTEAAEGDWVCHCSCGKSWWILCKLAFIHSLMLCWINTRM